MEPAPPQPVEQRNNHTPSPSSSSLAMPSSQGSPNTTPGLMGKHRMAAAISYLNQQIQIIQDELNELETIGGVSAVCPELISTVDSVPDALLPVTRGPADVGWERWFQGAQSSRGRRRWI
ncbi:Guanine nucleotide-binding protein subunit gamma 2 [Sesamum alatum]|uniref:Guanine nucleotide-binding protein subunit gamma 2 n=1 Tax=Sesamum alatum TaxID=300844 RepID=A0AAE1YRY3_9LAMI|nr:Guanine nucleotide-binding protein subunit gamma 2 [Sesamum alatum]